MTMTRKLRRKHDRLAAVAGVRSIRRPVTPGGSEHFDLYYLRTGTGSAHPVVIIPGGPGMASVAMHRRVRRHAAAGGFDAIMVEHRGVGLSRRTDATADLPPEALTIDQVVDDVAAVLDDAGVRTAVICGSSYGTYIAAGVGVRHPDRVRAMILDSPLLSHRDITAQRAAVRGLLLDGDHPETGALAPKVRDLVTAGVMTAAGGQVAAVLYGLGGATLLERQLDLLSSGRTRLWRAMNRIGKLTMRTVPYRNEPDLVGRIAFRELDYAPEPDGLPLDPSVALREIGFTPEPFEAEPYDLVVEMPRFDWPTVVVSGGRDVTTPPAVAEQIAALIPRAVLLRLPTMAHSVLNTRERAAQEIVAAVSRGDHARLARRAAELDALPASPPLRLATAALRWAGAAEAALPAALAT